MSLVTTVKDLRLELDSLSAKGNIVGFVPTMGALHSGHLSLVEQCLTDNDICVVSIFVNPTQFNNKEDLKAYPRTLERDCAFLAKLSNEIIVFAPSVEEVYPESDTRQFDFGTIDKVMEGKHRPGHFNGVAQVVSRLFDIVKPNRAYFGQKDFQQLAIIREMVKQLALDVEIVPMPIVREKNGLALSSRNERLTENEKDIAVNISKTLFDSMQLLNKVPVKDVLEKVISTVDAFEGLEVEYFEIVDGDSLQSISDWSDSDYVVGCIVVFCGNVRLIDNIIYKAKA